ncbi:MAG TPA: MFS transporter [Gammaproteobacteria bacterium]|nr:MFS transporter [Gammaproteobacteria bacterium]
MPVSQTAGRSQHARLAGFYFFYFASVGAFVPFWGLYLKALSFSPEQIGQLMAMTMLTKVIAPNLWGWIADHTGTRVGIIRLAALLAAAVFSGLLFVSDYWWMLATLGIFSFFWNAALPQFEATTLHYLGDGIHHYSHIRLWGSVGFIITVIVLGPVFEHIGIKWLPVIMLALLIAISINTLLVNERKGPQHSDVGSFGKALRQPVVIALLAVCFLLQASHGPYYAFYSIYMQDHGYTRGLIGWLWALGVIAEIGVFLCISRWLPRFGAPRLLRIALAVAAVRWLLIALAPDYLAVMLIAQIMHAGSFGLYHAAAICLIHQLFPGRLQGRGQALYSSLSFGLGGAVGSLMSGYMWAAAGGQWAYGAATLMAAVGVMVAWRGVRMPAYCYPLAATKI